MFVSFSIQTCIDDVDDNYFDNELHVLKQTQSLIKSFTNSI